MHGAKGLSGKVVFIPGAEQGLMPSLMNRIVNIKVHLTVIYGCDTMSHVWAFNIR